MPDTNPNEFVELLELHQALNRPEAAGLCERVIYNPEIHGDTIEADPGCEIWWWGNSTKQKHGN